MNALAGYTATLPGRPLSPLKWSTVRSAEADLKPLMIAGLDGDAKAYRELLEKLGSQLRAYFKGQLARINRGPVEAEDLVQEVLMAIHTRRHSLGVCDRTVQIPGPPAEDAGIYRRRSDRRHTRD